ncbi:hypothetical protein J2741_000228 [Methanolinea mesophila]|uniref:hypothetical protein n=1 Tax=Methanolinea mesophila TaxID=547055 RepID=UPI001AE14F95|nr:hypothetical protein [Methanolinea mesophila]MBP1927681.1 hypothetical protein [Methanolinea mesophila]
MRFRPILLSLIIVSALLLAGCTIPGTEGPSLPTDMLTSPGTPVPSPGTVPVTQAGPVIDPHDWSVPILTTPDRYIPLMSSTVGIRLDAGYNATIPVFYSWGTDYGHFVSWNATDGKVTTHDGYVETPDPSIYWTYSPEDMGKEKPPVTILLTVWEPTRYHGGGNALAYGEVHLTWENNDTAVVKRP